eukprot:6690172-Prorocentrum_lima.AAC.1
MTSSLVGSEMCIRDRLITLLAPARGVASPQPLPRVPLGGTRGSDPGAVSYTHLTLPTICSV